MKTDTPVSSNKTPATKNTWPLKSTSVSTTSDSIDNSVAADGSKSHHDKHAQSQTCTSAYVKNSTSAVAATETRTNIMSTSTNTKPVKSTPAHLTGNNVDQPVPADVSKSCHHGKHAQGQTHASTNAKKSTSAAAASDPGTKKMSASTNTNPMKSTSANMTTRYDQDKSLSADRSKSSQHDKLAQSQIHAAAVDPRTKKIPTSTKTKPVKSTSTHLTNDSIEQSVAVDGSQSSNDSKPQAHRQTHVLGNEKKKSKSAASAIELNTNKISASNKTKPTKSTSAIMINNDDDRSASADSSKLSHHGKHTQCQTPASANAKSHTSAVVANEHKTGTTSMFTNNMKPKTSNGTHVGEHISIVAGDDEKEDMLKEMLRKHSCSLCSQPTNSFKSKLSKHVESVHFNHYVLYNDKKSLLCKLDCTGNRGETHYHCSHCSTLYVKRYNLECHLETLRNSETKKTSSLVHISDKKKEACKVCNKQLQSKHMKKHMRTHNKKPTSHINEESHHDGILISRESGLYMISKSIRGNQYPLHVMKKVADMHQTLECEDTYCRAGYGMAARSKQVTKSCPHLQSTQFIVDTENTKNLHEPSLYELVRQKRISKERMNEMITKNAEAKASHQPAVAVFFPNGEDGRTFYLSVYTGVKESYCRLQRTIISVDTVQDRWTCGCERHKLKRGCGHKSLAKWFLYEHYPNKLKTLPQAGVTDGVSDVIDMTLRQNNIEDNYEKTRRSVSMEARKKMVEYIYSQKRIPLDISESVLNRNNKDIQQIIPTEDSCVCGASLRSENLKLISKAGMLVCLKFVKRDIKVYHKSCGICGTIVRHQDYKTNIINYNDHIFLTLNLCLWIRHSMQHATAPTNVLQTLQTIHRCSLPIQSLRSGYIFFETMTDYETDESAQNCRACGYHPVVQIFDANQKVCFKLNDEQLQADSNGCNDDTNKENSVNTSEFWAMVEKSIIYRAVVNLPFCKDNPFQVQQSYTKFAPWIAPQSRSGQLSFNTEREKVKFPGQSVNNKNTTDDLTEPTDDLTEDMITYLKTVGKKAAAVELADDCGLSTSGKSMTTIISMLENHIRQGNDCSKLFEKFARKSGGIMLGMCTHGIVHCMKFMLTYESPRDIVDLLKSLKYHPNVTICDIPQQVVNHGNKREEGMFSDNGGMICENTSENIQAAKDGTLEINLEYIEKAAYAHIQEDTAMVQDHSYADKEINTQEHPLSGSSSRLVLFDRLHEKNTCDEANRLLRSVKFVPQIRGEIDSEVAEHKNAFMSEDKYFLDMLGHEHHLIVTRSILLVKNKEINKRLYRKMQNFSMSNERLHLDICGRLMSSTGKQMAHMNNVQQGNGEISAPNDSSITKRKQSPITKTMSKKKKINTDEQTVQEDIQEVVIIPAENVQKVEVAIKAEVDDTDASEVFMSEIQSTTAKVTSPDQLFSRGDSFYAKSLDILYISPFCTDIWRKPKITRAMLMATMKANGKSLTPETSPFSMSVEGMRRLLDDEYLNGEVIDACLLMLSGLGSVHGNHTFAILPNQFLSLSNPNQGVIKEWIPPIVISKQCSGVFMAANHPQHWCAVAVDIDNRTVLYIDSCPSASSSKKKQCHMEIIKHLCLLIDGKCRWTFLDHNLAVAQYLNIPEVPTQSTSVDCGVFVIIYLWMCMCHIIEGAKSWFHKSISIPASDMGPIRRFLSYLLVAISANDRISEAANVNDTSKWMNIKLFPQDKKLTRISNRILGRSTVDSIDKERFVKVHFPHTFALIEYIRVNNIKEVRTPRCMQLDTQGFKQFMRCVLSNEEKDFRDQLLFRCFGETGYTCLMNILSLNNWAVNYQVEQEGCQQMET